MHPFGLLLASAPLIVAVLIMREIRLAHCLRTVGIETMGRVLRQRESNGRGGKHYIPTIGFTTQLGQPLEGESAGSATNLEFFDGDEVLLYYDPDQPTRFLLVQELPNTRRYGYLALIGLVLLICLFGQGKN